MKFFTTTVKEEDRHTEPRVHDVPTGYPMPPKHEEITLTIQMTGSGDTRKFTSQEIVSIVMERLKEIEPMLYSAEYMSRFNGLYTLLYTVLF